MSGPAGSRGRTGRARAAALLLAPALAASALAASDADAAGRLVAAPERVEGLAMDGGTGGAVLAWTAPLASGESELQWAEVGARGGVARRGALRPAAAGLTLHGLDVADSGAAVVCATERIEPAYRSWLAVRAGADAAFRTVELPVDALADPIVCGVAADGRALVAWTSEGRLRAVALTASGRVGRVVTLARGANDAAPRIAVAADGSAAVSFLRGGTTRSGAGARQTAHVVRRSASGRWGRPRALGRAAAASAAAPHVAADVALAPRFGWAAPGALTVAGAGSGPWRADLGAGPAPDEDPLALAGGGGATIAAWRARDAAPAVEPEPEPADETPAAEAASRRGAKPGARDEARGRGAGRRAKRAAAARRARRAADRRPSRARRAAAARRARRAAARRARARAAAAVRPGLDWTLTGAVSQPRRGRAGRPRRAALARGSGFGPLLARAASDRSGALVWGGSDDERVTLHARRLGRDGRWSAARTIASAPAFNPGSADGQAFGYEHVALAALPDGATLVAWAQPQREWRQRLMVASVGAPAGRAAARARGAKRR